MKQLSLLLAIAFICSTVSAQNPSKVDTIHIGNITIVKKKGAGSNDGWDKSIQLGRHRKNKASNVTTNWFIFDLGFANYNDKTNYSTVPASYFSSKPGQPAIGANDFKLRTGKSIDVNLWFFMQRINLAKQYVHLQYGLGLELNNYRFKSNLSFKENGTNPYPPYNANTGSFVLRDSIAFSKDKLAADYITVPLMLHFTSNPVNSDKAISLGVGVSAGYLYSQRNKQKSSERGKDKNRGDYDMEKFKLSYVAELGLGPVKLYGSYSPKSIFNNSLDFRPYTVGLRFSNW
ncbi:MAG: hypothetical protein ABJA78_08055 [Ferruginibacter sp.]